MNDKKYYLSAKILKGSLTKWTVCPLDLRPSRGISLVDESVGRVNHAYLPTSA